MIHKAIFSILLLLVLFATAPGCKESKLDPRDLADALSEELTDALEFDNGDVTAGPTPEADPSGAQISAFTAPMVAGKSIYQSDGTPVGFPYGETFIVTLYATSNLDNVVGAVAHIRQANKDDYAPGYIRIEPPTSWDPGTGEMTLTARVNQHDRDGVDVSGNSFHISLALLSDDGTGVKAGNYLDWNLSTYPPTGGDNRVPMCKCRSEFEGGQPKDTNVAFLGDCPAASLTGKHAHATADVSPCSLFNEYVSGYNTISDGVLQIMPDPSYQDTATLNYAAGSRFYPTPTMVETPDQIDICGLEIECPGDDLFCNNDGDCSPPDDICCNHTCTNSRTDPDHCGDCGTVCGAGALCAGGTCGGEPRCGDPTILAAWDFENTITGTQPSILAPNVTAPRFTSNTPPPEHRLGGGFAWVIEEGWLREGTFLSCTIMPAMGYEIQVSALRFEQAVPNAPGPGSWRATYVLGGPEVDIGAGAIPPQPLVFQPEAIDPLGLVVTYPDAIEFRWFAEGADELWGLDNVTFEGRVCTMP